MAWLKHLLRAICYGVMMTIVFFVFIILASYTAGQYIKNKYGCQPQKKDSCGGVQTSPSNGPTTDTTQKKD